MQSNDDFDLFLRRQLTSHSDYLEDAGFSAQVMSRLPAQRRLTPWMEKIILWLPAVFISCLVLWQLPWRHLVQPVYAFWLTTSPATLINTLGFLFFCIALCITLINSRRSL